MSNSPRIILHNSNTSQMTQWLTDAHPDADFRACNDYASLPGLIESYKPDVVYSVRFAGSVGYPRDALFGPNAPKWVANGGAGTDHFGVWDTNKTTVTNAAGVAAGMMAEFIMGGFLHFTLDVPGLQKDQSNCVWNTSRKVRPLAGSTLLIIGLGHTGQALAARAKAFGMTVLGTRARVQLMENIDEVHGAEDLADLLPRADFISVSTPLIQATRGLIGEAEIAAMKPGVIFADVSRGGVVDQTALRNALVSGHVAAAALDVFEAEPLPADSELWELENVLISPHCSSVYDGWEKASFDLFLKNLDLWSKGQELFNVVNPDRGY